MVFRPMAKQFCLMSFFRHTWTLKISLHCSSLSCQVKRKQALLESILPGINLADDKNVPKRATVFPVALYICPQVREDDPVCVPKIGAWDSMRTFLFLVCIAVIGASSSGA